MILIRDIRHYMSRKRCCQAIYTESLKSVTQPAICSLCHHFSTLLRPHNSNAGCFRLFERLECGVFGDNLPYLAFVSLILLIFRCVTNSDRVHLHDRSTHQITRGDSARMAHQRTYRLTSSLRIPAFSPSSVSGNIGNTSASSHQVAFQYVLSYGVSCGWIHTMCG